MKKTALILLLAISAFAAHGQSADTTSTVVGRKLNFEMPLFGITKPDVRPTWSAITFEEATGGVNYMVGVPAGMNTYGYYAEISMVALHYRPWRDSNMFALELVFGASSNDLKKGYAFADDGSIAAVPKDWDRSESFYIEQTMSLQFGYVKEFGKWKTGVFAVPSCSFIQLGNEYHLQGVSGLRHQDYITTGYLFRMGFKAGLWYDNLGFSVAYRPSFDKSTSTLPLYEGLQFGVSVRY